MEYTITIQELVERPIIRNDFNVEWMNKMTDEEISQYYKESYYMCLGKGTSDNVPDISVAYLTRHIDRCISYNLLKLE